MSKWKLNAIPSESKEDIGQILLSHIAQKWHLYNPTRPLGNWLTRVIQNRMKNLMRDKYYKFSPPCLDCPSYLGKNDNGEGDCKLFGTCNSECKIYKVWEEEKKTQMDINLPITIEGHYSQEVHNQPFQEINFDHQIDELKIKLEERLTHFEYLFFIKLYLENRTDLEAINDLKYKNKAKAGRIIKELKGKIVDLVKTILREEDLD